MGYEGYKAYLSNQRILHPGGPGVVAHTATDATTADSTTLGSALSKTGILAVQPRHLPAIEDYRAVMAQRAIFQSIASMGLPAFTIHSIVRYSGRALKDVKNVRVRSYGPIGVSFA